MSNANSTDNREANRGNFYQCLVAVSYALSKPDLFRFKKIIIEHDGDISFDSKYQIETKHHIKKPSLGDKNEDFWKTLYNWLKQSEKKSFDHLVLFTTSTFPKKGLSHLKKWNKSSTSERLEILKKINFSFNLDTFSEYQIGQLEIDILKNKGIPEKTITNIRSLLNKKFKNETSFVKELNKLSIPKDQNKTILKECKDTSKTKYKVWNYSRYILSYNETALLKILGKVTLELDQPIDTDLIEKIAFNPKFEKSEFPLKDRSKIINDNIAGFMYAKVSGSKKWEVNHFQFHNIINQHLDDYFRDTIKPIYEKYKKAQVDESTINQLSERKFVKELSEINCDSKDVKGAIVDFWRTNSLLSEENENNPVFNNDEYAPYKEEIFSKISSLKKITSIESTITDYKKKSLLFYHKTKNENYSNVYRKTIPDMNYLTHGTTHIIVEDHENDFNWIIDD